jgi:hypothetical protein
MGLPEIRTDTSQQNTPTREKNYLSVHWSINQILMMGYHGAGFVPRSLKLQKAENTIPYYILVKI